MFLVLFNAIHLAEEGFIVFTVSTLSALFCCFGEMLVYGLKTISVEFQGSNQML